jgi:IS30 family transposase
MNRQEVAMRYFSPEEKTDIWERLANGQSVRSIAQGLGRQSSSVRKLVMSTGGAPMAVVKPRSPHFLSMAEREEISRGVLTGLSFRTIAKQLHRCPSTISREVSRNGSVLSYRAHLAEKATTIRARRPKAAKLVLNPALRAIVEAKLELRWSPQQISAWLFMTYPDDKELHVSHERIYMSLFVQGRGALRRQLHKSLRTGRALRRRQGSQPYEGQGHIPDMVLISDRPAEIEDRAIPGHWEGDLIMGRGKMAIGTLVERSTRYVMLIALEKPTAENVRVEMTRKIMKLPEQLRKSITWDRGKEMAQHRQFTIDSGIHVYFCDPRSPWQRGSNENTNGLLRQYLPKGTDLSIHTEEELDAIAEELNNRPRQTLNWMTPLERFAQVLQ